MRMENTTVWRYISFWNMVIFHCPAGFQYRKKSSPELKGSTCYQPPHELKIRHVTPSSGNPNSSPNIQTPNHCLCVVWRLPVLGKQPQMWGTFCVPKCPRSKFHKWWLENGSSSWLRTGRKGRLTSIPFRKEQLQICGSFISSLGPKPAFVDTKVTLSITMTILSWDNFHPKHNKPDFFLLPNLLISSQTKTHEQQKRTTRVGSAGVPDFTDRFSLLGFRPPPLSPLPKSARIPVACKAIWISPLENADAFFRENVFWSICSECICVYII